MATPWTEEREAELRSLWSEGLTAAIIAGRMGVSRNAILGKSHRLGLNDRRQGVAAIRVKRAAKRVRRERQTEISDLVAERIRPGRPVSAQAFEPLEGTRPVTLLDLEPHHCRWPIGDPQDASFGFCGCKRAAGTPYCEAHANRAYQGRTAEDLLEEQAA